MTRQWAKKTTPLFVCSLLFLAACENTSDKQVGAIDSVEGPLGGAASDEPRATLVAQDILSAGGTAADAATALYFTLAVTYPVAGALGGGGECIVYNNKKNELENLKFPVGQPAAGGEVGIPGNIRGFAALHARYGRVAWSALLSQAETYANFGESLSRAQHMAMVTSSSTVRFNTRLEELYKKDDGSFRTEGEKIQQVRLASVLTSLRSNGGAHFYGGNVGKSFIEDANSVGGKLTNSDLINYRPVWTNALMFDVDSNIVGVSDSPYGALFRDFWEEMFEGKGFLHFSTDLPLEKLVKASGKSFQRFQARAPFESSATTSFVTADNEGNAVSCVIGLKKPFGTGKAGDITGIVMAPNISAEKSAFPSTPLLMVNKPNKDFYYASAASGGAVATFASAYTALQVFAEGKTLESAINAPRAFTMAPGAPLLYERELGGEALNSLQALHPVQIEVNRMASVNAIFCLNGKVFNCQSRSDPRGYGLSMIQK